MLGKEALNKDKLLDGRRDTKDGDTNYCRVHKTMQCDVIVLVLARRPRHTYTFYKREKTKEASAVVHVVRGNSRRIKFLAAGKNTHEKVYFSVFERGRMRSVRT